MKLVSLITIFLLFNLNFTMEPVQMLNCGTRIVGLYQSFYPNLMTVKSFEEFNQLISTDRTSRDLTNALDACGFSISNIQFNKQLFRTCAFQMSSNIQLSSQTYNLLSENGLNSENFVELLKLVNPAIMTKDICQSALQTLDLSPKASSSNLRQQTNTQLIESLQKKEEYYGCGEKVSDSYSKLQKKFMNVNTWAELKTSMFDDETTSTLKQTIENCGYVAPPVVYNQEKVENCQNELFTNYQLISDIYNDASENGLQLQHIITGMDILESRNQLSKVCFEAVESVQFEKMLDFFIEGKWSQYNLQSKKCQNAYETCVKQMGTGIIFVEKVCKDQLKNNVMCTQ